MTSKIRALIWDVGGVLIRTEDKNPRKNLAQKMGVGLSELENVVFETETSQIATVGKISASEHWDTVAKHFNLDDSELAAFQKEFWAGDRMDYELLQFIQSKRPAIKTALLSNAWSSARQEIGEPTGLLNYFDVSIFSAEVFLAKPDLQIFTLVLNKLDVQPDEAIFVDDVEQNIQAACSLGIQGIRFVSSQQIVEDVQKLLLA